ncbi:hypothetical protein FPV67DRAFT_1485043 [Lyophyllum atratum]|nr:hypothetical protein FPV67DRAFT_1485043 [Lyophyllum atratum]
MFIFLSTLPFNSTFVLVTGALQVPWLLALHAVKNPLVSSPPAPSPVPAVSWCSSRAGAQFPSERLVRYRYAQAAAMRA